MGSSGVLTSEERIVHKTIEARHRERIARVVRVGSLSGQTLHPWPQIITPVAARERQMGSFLADIVGADHDIAGHFALDPKAPALFVGCLVRPGGAQRAIRAEANIVHQAERIACGLD